MDTKSIIKMLKYNYLKQREDEIFKAFDGVKYIPLEEIKKKIMIRIQTIYGIDIYHTESGKFADLNQLI